jgi:hypothetical protein
MQRVRIAVELDVVVAHLLRTTPLACAGCRRQTSVDTSLGWRALGAEREQSNWTFCEMQQTVFKSKLEFIPKYPPAHVNIDVQIRLRLFVDLGTKHLLQPPISGF